MKHSQPIDTVMDNILRKCCEWFGGLGSEWSNDDTTEFILIL